MVRMVGGEDAGSQEASWTADGAICFVSLVSVGVDTTEHCNKTNRGI